MATQKKRNVKQEVVKRVIAAWRYERQEWYQQPLIGGPCILPPISAITGEALTSSDPRWLATTARLSDPRWCTIDQANSQGWSVRRGAKGVTVAAGDAAKNAAAAARALTVFHASQIEGIPPLEYDLSKTHEFDLHEEGEKLFDRNPGSAPIIFVDNPNQRASLLPSCIYYDRRSDEIHLPPHGHFIDAGHLYAIMAHEIAHSTMHRSRLRRDRGVGGKVEAAKEELRAEMASFMLLKKTGIPHHPDNQARYAAAWLRCLSSSDRCLNRHDLYRAAEDAERIADYVIEQQKLTEIEALPSTVEPGSPDNHKARPRRRRPM